MSPLFDELVIGQTCEIEVLIAGIAGPWYQVYYVHLMIPVFEFRLASRHEIDEGFIN